MSETASVGALVRAARGGDESAWNQLVARYMPLVRSVIARHRLMIGDAGDVNQTVWLRLVEHLEEIRDPGALPGWIATTTRHECLRVLAARKRALAVDPSTFAELELAEDDIEAVEDLLLRDERHQALREGLAQLPQKRRELLLLLLVDPPLSYDDISKRLGIPIGSIGPTRARCLDQLRKTPALTRLVKDGHAVGARRQA